MSTMQTAEIRELNAADVDAVSGGFVMSSLGAFLAGAAVGYGIRRGVEALVDWIFG
jgi:hypothetical protein